MTKPTRRTNRSMLAFATILSIIALLVGVDACQHGDIRSFVGAVSLGVAAVCVTWLGLRRQPVPDQEPVVAYWIDEVPNLARNRVTVDHDPRIDALLAVARKTGTGAEPEDSDGFAERVTETCQTDEDHYFPSPEEMGIDPDAVSCRYFDCACGKQYDGRYDNVADAVCDPEGGPS